MSDKDTRYSEVERQLVSVRDWLKRHVDNSLEARQPRGWGSSPTGTDGWTVAAIPDWDVKQRIAEINEALETDAA